MGIRNSVRNTYSAVHTTVSSLFLLGICFFLGTVGGYIWSAGTAKNVDILTSYIQGYLSAVSDGDWFLPSLGSVVWNVFRWPLITFLLAFTVIGRIGIPIVFTVRGILLSFAVTSFVAALGYEGAWIAFLLFGVSGLFALPALFVLGVQGIDICRSLTSKLPRGSRKAYNRTCLFRSAICAAVLVLCVFLEQTLIPSALLLTAGV